MQDSTDTRSGAISRRTIAKGAAWSLPVIATAAAAPAASASEVCAVMVAAAPASPIRWSESGNHFVTVTVTNGGKPVKAAEVTATPGRGSGFTVGPNPGFTGSNGTVLLAVQVAKKATSKKFTLNVTTPDGCSASTVLELHHRKKRC